jgi:hypothetical protein
MTLRKIENIDGKQIFFYGFFYVCVKFHGNFLLNVVILSPFVGIANM